MFPARQIRFALGDATNLGKAKNLSEPLQHFMKRFETPVPTSEKFHDYLTFHDRKQAFLKGVGGWFMPAQTETGTRNKRGIQPRDLVTMDVDYATPEFQENLLAGKFVPGICLFAHSSRRHTPEKPRLRVMVIADSPIPPEQYPAVCRILSQIVDPNMEHIDKVSARVAQMMYMPTVSSNMIEHYVFYQQPGKLLDWKGMVADWETINGTAGDLSNLPRYKGEQELRESAEKAEDPLLKDSPIGTFCRAYSITELVEGKKGEPGILADYYEVVDYHEGMATRLTYIKGTTTSGAVVYDDKFVYSHHGSDPAQDQLMNAYDLVRCHLFNSADDEDDTPMKDRESVKAMNKWAGSQPGYNLQSVEDRYDLNTMFEDDDDQSWVQQATTDEIAAELLGEGYARVMAAEAKAKRDFVSDLLGSPVEDTAEELPRYQRQQAGKPPENWVATELELGQDGSIKSTLHNIATIITNDPRFFRKIAYNEFAQNVVLLASIKTKSKTIPPVVCSDTERGMLWVDFYNLSIRAVIEAPNGPGKAGYGFKSSDRDLVGGVALAARNNAFHPIKEKISRWRSAGWDGVDRIGTFLHRFVGCEQTEYTAMAFRMMLIASIARIETPGCKFDYALIFEGKQGIGKSTLIKVIYGSDYFGEIDCDLSNRREVAEQTSGKWALELPELSSLHKADHNAAKQFMRRQDDDVREAYGRELTRFPRQNVIWGTTNDSKYLRDPTGNRSYWPVRCEVNSIDLRGVLAERDQLWAQAVHEYDQMRRQYNGDLPLTLTGEALREAKRLQERARQKEMWENWSEAVLDWATQPVTLATIFHEQERDTAELIDLPGGLSEDTLVQRVAFAQEHAFEAALGLRKSPLTNNIMDSAWEKVVSHLVEQGFIHGDTRPYVGGKRRRWVIFPAVTKEDLKRGFTSTGEAEPTRNDMTPNPEDLL
ncbi:virulence-associated E family protein [Silicimonas algicola]|nr:virulence-associated E family protein [Silicimonas algicola]